MRKYATRYYGPILIAVFLLAFGLRLYALAADPPLHLSLSQGLNTDAWTTIQAARMKLNFGEWDLYPDPRVLDLYYFYLGMNWLAYLTFLLFGVGFWQANFMPVVMGLLSIAWIAGFARQQFGWRVSLLAALFLTTNFVYVMYNRIPITYPVATAGMTFSLFLWGLGLRRPLYFFFSGLAAALTVAFIKVVGLAFIPAGLAGTLILAWRRRQAGQSDVYRPLLYFVIGPILVAGLYYLFVSNLPPRMVTQTTHSLQKQTFSPTYGLEENIRLVVQSLLQFGTRSGFVLRMLPLFVLAMGYTAWQLLTIAKKLPTLPVGEIVALLYFGSVLGMLLVFAAAVRPTRYVVPLIPPICLVAALALDAWLRAERIQLPKRFGRLYPIYIQLILTYLIYQVLEALLKLISMIRLQTGLADWRVIHDVATLYTVFTVALVLALIVTFGFLWRVKVRRRAYIPIQNRNWVALLFVIAIVGGDMIQYLAWARDPQFSLVESSRQIAQDLGDNVTLGGPYAQVLTMENKQRSFYFKPGSYRDYVYSHQFDYLVTEADSLLKNGPFNDEQFYNTMPELMNRASLVREYYIRGYLIKVYQVDIPDPPIYEEQSP